MLRKRIRRFYEIATDLRKAHNLSGKGYSVLLQEAYSARKGVTKNGFGEYFKYRLYDENLVSRENRGTFLNSGFAHQIWAELNPPKWSGLAIDKIFFQLILQELGFQQPKLLACYDKKARSVPGIKNLHSETGIREFLYDNDHYPLFAKPIDSYRSMGAMGIRGVDKAAGDVELSNGKTISIEKTVEEITSKDNYIFQQKLSPAPELIDLCGESLPTLRMIILGLETGPTLFRVVWKIPSKENMADNFWRTGNLVAHVDPHNGQITDVIQSTANGPRRVEASESLGKRLLGNSPPGFTAASELVHDLGSAFPMFHFQAWDIALTAEGPIAIELNHNGDLELLQVGARAGLYTGEFIQLLKEQGVNLEKPMTWAEWSKKG